MYKRAEYFVIFIHHCYGIKVKKKLTIDSDSEKCLKNNDFNWIRSLIFLT